MHRIKQYSTWRRHKRPRDGQTFAKSCHCLSDHFHRSQLEGRVCDELRLRKMTDPPDIKDYRVEVRIPLVLDGLNLGVYIADFVIEHMDGTTEILEVKGLVFEIFKKKWKILEHMFRDKPMIKMTIVKK